MNNLNTLCIAVLMGGGASLVGCLPEGNTASTEQAVLGDHGIADLRAQYGLSGAGVSGRPLGELAGPVSSTVFSQIETDLNTVIGAAGHASCTRANGCLQFLDQNGGTTFPTNDPFWQKQVVTDLIMMVAANPAASTFKIVVANSTSDSDGLAAITTLDGLSGVVGAHLAIDWAESATHVGDMENVISASDKVYTARAGLFPGLSPEVVAVAATDYSAGSTDFVWSQSAAQCSTTFAKQSYEPSLCSGGKRIGADVSAVGHALPIQFNGSATTVDSLTAPAAFILGRLSLQTSAIATRADLFSGSAAKRTDVTSGTDVFGHTAITGTDLPSGLGVPSGNLTK